MERGKNRERKRAMSPCWHYLSPWIWEPKARWIHETSRWGGGGQPIFPIWFVWIGSLSFIIWPLKSPEVGRVEFNRRERALRWRKLEQWVGAIFQGQITSLNWQLSYFLLWEIEMEDQSLNYYYYYLTYMIRKIKDLKNCSPLQE